MEMKPLSGGSDEEIAARLGLSKTAVSTRISRGRQLLRDIEKREGFRMEAHGTLHRASPRQSSGPYPTGYAGPDKPGAVDSGSSEKRALSRSICF